MMENGWDLLDVNGTNVGRIWDMEIRECAGREGMSIICGYL